MRQVILSSLVSFSISSDVYSSACAFPALHSVPNAALLQVKRDNESKQLLGKATILEDAGSAESSRACCSDRTSQNQSAGALLRLIHITKTGGTALENWGNQHGFLWGAWWLELQESAKSDSFYLNVKPEARTHGMMNESWHIPSRYFYKDPYESYELFTTVRDPYARMISEFRCPWNGFREPFRCKKKKNRDARLALRTTATVADLNRWVVDKLLNGSSRPPFQTGHMVPQYLYIFDASGARRIPEENVLRMERLDQDFASLRTRYNISGGKLEHINESEMKHFDVADLSELALQLIEREYRTDFDYFGYPRFSKAT